MDFQELAEEAFSDLLKKHDRPIDRNRTAAKRTRDRHGARISAEKEDDEKPQDQGLAGVRMRAVASKRSASKLAVPAMAGATPAPYPGFIEPCDPTFHGKPLPNRYHQLFRLWTFLDFLPLQLLSQFSG